MARISKTEPETEPRWQPNLPSTPSSLAKQKGTDCKGPQPNPPGQLSRGEVLQESFAHGRPPEPQRLSGCPQGGPRGRKWRSTAQNDPSRRPGCSALGRRLRGTGRCFCGCRDTAGSPGRKAEGTNPDSRLTAPPKMQAEDFL